MNCGYPIPDNMMDNDYRAIAGYTHPPMAGSSVLLGCLFGKLNFELNITVTITCTDNGQWQPDPNQIKCIGDFLILV